LRIASSLLALLAVLAATAAVYAQVASFEFVTWDDPLYVTSNAVVQQGLTREGAIWALGSRVDSNWLPLTWLSHMLDVELFGAWAGGHHLTNLVLHALATALLFGLLMAATRDLVPSALVAALFALHPLHVEVVAWVSQRKELLSTVFGLLAALLYVWWTRRGGALRYAAMLIAFAAALASKPMLVTLPFVLLLLDWWPLRRDASRRLVLEKLPLFALSAAACAVAFASQLIARTNAPELSLALRLANAAVACFRYLALAFWPSGLSILYPHPYAPELGGEPWSPALVAAACAGLVAISAAVLRARAHRYLAVGWLWYLGTLVPVIGLIQIGPQGMADRYSYVPLVGIFIAIAWGARDAVAASAARRPALRTAAVVLALFALGVAGFASHARARVWRSSEALYLASLAATPRNPVLLYNLGVVQAQQGRVEEAAQSYAAALAIDPHHPAANTNLGNIRLRAGHPEEAIAHYRSALSRDPDDVETLQNLGRVLAFRGDLTGAAQQLERAARLAPMDPSVMRDLESVRESLREVTPGRRGAS
jgi:tetratricopeptide (TPR) repeat protein